MKYILIAFLTLSFGCSNNSVEGVWSGEKGIIIIRNGIFAATSMGGMSVKGNYEIEENHMIVTVNSTSNPLANLFVSGMIIDVKYKVKDNKLTIIQPSGSRETYKREKT